MHLEAVYLKALLYDQFITIVGDIQNKVLHGKQDNRFSDIAMEITENQYTQTLLMSQGMLEDSLVASNQGFA